MTEDTILEGKPMFRDTDHAAEQLQYAWAKYRMQIQVQVDFEARTRMARDTLEMGRMVNAACALLRQSGRDLVECEKHIQNLRQTFLKLQAD